MTGLDGVPNDPRDGLALRLTAIAEELEAGAPTIVKLLEKAEREAEERQKKYEIERRERERKEAERQRVENEKARIVEFKEQLERWRLARDARALVAEINELVTSHGLRVSKGGPVEEWLDWIMKRADEADPLAQLRKEVVEMTAQYETFARPRSHLGTQLALRRRQRGERQRASLSRAERMSGE